MKKKTSFVFYIIDVLVVAGLIFLDQFTKAMVVEKLKGQPPYSIIGDFFTFRYLENKGAAFSILQNQQIFFLVVGVVFCIVVLGALVYIPPAGKYHVLRTCFIFLFAGAVGNMIDRYTNAYVVDFISVGTFPVFNVADIYVTVSTFALVILVLFVFKEEELNFKSTRHPKVHSSMIYRSDEASSKSEDVIIKSTQKSEDKDNGKGADKDSDKDEEQKPEEKGIE